MRAAQSQVVELSPGVPFFSKPTGAWFPSRKGLPEFKPAGSLFRDSPRQQETQNPSLQILPVNI